MKPTQNSVVNFTIDHGWTAYCKAPDGEEWELPVIGWATVAAWVGDETEDYPGTHQIEVDAVVLDEDCYPTPLRSYRRDLADGYKVQVTLKQTGTEPTR